jgi:hypothetical protein
MTDHEGNAWRIREIAFPWDLGPRAAPAALQPPEALSTLAGAASGPACLALKAYRPSSFRRPRSTVRRPFRRLRYAVSSPLSIFVYSFPYSLTIAPPPTSKACPAAVCAPLSIPPSPQSTVRRPQSAVRRLSTIHHDSQFRCRNTHAPKTNGSQKVIPRYVSVIKAA